MSDEVDSSSNGSDPTLQPNQQIQSQPTPQQLPSRSAHRQRQHRPWFRRGSSASMNQPSKVPIGAATESVLHQGDSPWNKIRHYRSRSDDPEQALTVSVPVTGTVPVPVVPVPVTVPVSVPSPLSTTMETLATTPVAPNETVSLTTSGPPVFAEVRSREKTDRENLEREERRMKEELKEKERNDQATKNLETCRRYFFIGCFGLPMLHFVSFCYFYRELQGPDSDFRIRKYILLSLFFGLIQTFVWVLWFVIFLLRDNLNNLSIDNTDVVLGAFARIVRMN